MSILRAYVRGTPWIIVRVQAVGALDATRKAAKLTGRHTRDVVSVEKDIGSLMPTPSTPVMLNLTGFREA